ncbi:MAG: hypothetical protein KVP17_002917 [Porospora cf. gigantea B]|uniref:uncharacterized protein n=1 Tax=Porospora cf. gigantea B TaxID=2853592 RepID=UPI003571EDC6|nr:MAG: hypothetical protein KVP17_002917 [Porospora cf. gigantea B]
MTPWPVHEDGDYSSYKPLLDSKVNSWCPAASNGARSFMYNDSGFYSLHADQALYATQDRGTVDKLVKVLDGSGSVGEYLRAHWGLVVLLVLMVLVSLLSCVHCCLARNPRQPSKLYAKMGCCKPSKRQSVSAFTKRQSWSWGLFTLLLLVPALLGFSIASVVYASNAMAGQVAATCDTWLTLDGQFFGSDGLLNNDSTDVVLDWKGTQSQYDELQHLGGELKPGEDNPLKQLIEGEFKKMEVGLIDSSIFYNDLLQNERAIVAEVTLLTEETSTAIAPKYPIQFSMRSLADSKINEYAWILSDTTSSGIDLMTDNIASLLGPSSKLLDLGYDVATTGLGAISDVGASIAHITGMLDLSLGIGNGVIFSLLAVGLLGQVLLLVVGILAVWLVVVMLKIRKNKLTADDDAGVTRRAFNLSRALTFTSLAALAVLAVVGSISLLIARVGSDACTIIEDDIIRDGRVELLGEDMLVSGETDMRGVLGTCLVSSGDGDVAATLGLRRKVEDVGVTIEKTKVLLEQQVKNVLDLESKRLMAQMIQVLFNDLSKATMALNNGGPVAEQMTSTTLPDYEYVFPAIFDQPLQLFCGVMGMGRSTANMGALCLSGLTFTARSEDKMVEYLDGFSPSRSICTKHLSKLGYQCPTTRRLQVDPSAEELSTTEVSTATESTTETPTGGSTAEIESTESTTETETTTTLKPTLLMLDETSVRADIEAIEIYDCSQLGEASCDAATKAKWIETANKLIDLQKFMYHNITFDDATSVLKPLACPKSGPCTFDDVHRFLAPRWQSMGKDLYDNYVLTKSQIDWFLNDLTIKMMDDLMVESRAALDHFNCQYLGTALSDTTAKGLCHTVLPSMNLYAVLVLWSVPLALIAAVLFWRVYHYWFDSFTFESFQDASMSLPIIANQSQAYSPRYAGSTESTSSDVSFDSTSEVSSDASFTSSSEDSITNAVYSPQYSETSSSS